MIIIKIRYKEKKRLGEINVFKCFLKAFKESTFLKDAGMLFHNLGPV